MTPVSFLQLLKCYWRIEILRDECREFSWRRVRQKCKRSNRYAYLFWFRVAYVMYMSRSAFWRRRAKLLNERISRIYNVEIMLGAEIGEGLWIAHPSAIVISSHAVIGKNFKVWQGCTVGVKGGDGPKCIRIGDNVSLAAHSCIIGNNVEVGENTSFGAMSFVNKDVPAGSKYVTRKVSEITFGD